MSPQDAIKYILQMIRISNTMERLQANVGVSTAIKAMKLLQLLIKLKISEEDNKEFLPAQVTDLTSQVEKLDKKVKAWNRTQYIRMLEQLLTLVSFIFSLGTMSLGPNSILFDILNNVFMSGANGISLFMDIYWPFTRDANAVVEFIDLKDIFNIAKPELVQPPKKLIKSKRKQKIYIRRSRTINKQKQLKYNELQVPLTEKELQPILVK